MNLQEKRKRQACLEISPSKGYGLQQKPMKIVGLPEYTQAIQPYQFGHPYSKRTCLWLKGLPNLIPTEILAYHEPYINGGCKDAYGNYRRFQGRKERDPKIRSKTFPGVAKAMAEQWG